MAKDTRTRLTIEEGQKLLIGSAFNQMPEKLGEIAFSLPERNGANTEMGRLFRELKAYSPLMQRRDGLPGRRFVFGPIECWEPVKAEDGTIRDHNLMLPDTIVEVRLSPDAVNGAIWVLVFGLHPASHTALRIMEQEEILWPIAEKLRKVDAIRTLIGKDKETHRRFDDDPDEEELKENGNGKAAAKDPQEAEVGG